MNKGLERPMLERTKLRELILVIVAWLLGIAFANYTHAASPRLSNIQPRGVQRGAEHVLTFNGNNLGDAQEIFFYEKGFEVLEVKGEGNKATVKVKVSSDCRLGEHVAQVRTASGISDYRTIYVEGLPVLNEKEPNSVFETPQEISLNHVVNGHISNEDVDYYVVQATKGQRITAEIVAMRLSTANFDPYVAILDEKRFELATNDDTALALQDGFASVIAPADGKYIIEVRESAYAAGSNYRLHVGTFPRPKAVFPPGGKLGTEIDVKYLGMPTGDLAAKIKLPETDVTDFGVVAMDAGGIAPTANNFRLFSHDNAFEKEPNNSFDVASPAELPLAFNGTIETPGDVDFYKFAAKKGQAFDVECFARRIRSGLDPVMNIYKTDRGGLVGNDDSRGPDSYVRFTVPADGEYYIRIADHLGRGGPDLVYRIEFQPVKPKLSLGIPRNERYGQFRQQIYVPKGNRFGTLISAKRENFGGDLKLLGENLPPGITMHCVDMPANQNTMPVVFEATADAQLNGKLIDFLATHTDPSKNITGGFRNRADYIIAGPGQSLYRWKDVDKLAMAVINEIPFKLDVVQPKVPIVRDGSMHVKIVATKKEGWDEDINITFPYRPPGLGASSSVKMPKGKNEILYPINANGNAEIKEWKFYALGSSQGHWGATQLANLKIADAYARFELQRPACEQGQEAAVLCKVNHTTPFEGEATATLVGLPPKVTAEPLKLTKDTKELTFTLKTQKDSPVGKHNLICQLVIPMSGESVTSRAGTVQFQIDKPLPPPKNAPKPKPPAAKPAEKPKADAPKKPEPPKAKPLTRLQKLRKAAEERQKARNDS